ncbi:neprilysin-11-like isoform X2 [Periplaneta americana]|uniref:neprilysin-11-like isoform X2 n=2 Tax=Periplaneta americana TaxID=6978 RepID=UPI0037E769FA
MNLDAFMVARLCLRKNVCNTSESGPARRSGDRRCLIHERTRLLKFATPQNAFKQFVLLMSAAALLQSMDRDVDPCENFYAFACGRWGEEHPTPDGAVVHNWYADRQQKLLRRIEGRLQENISDWEPRPVSQARVLYRSCMLTEELDAQGLEPMFRFLREIGLPERPNLTVVDEWDTASFKWVPVSVKAKRRVMQDLLVGLSVVPLERNNTVNKLHLGTPEVSTLMPEYRDRRRRLEKRRRKMMMSNIEEALEDPYLEYIQQVMSYIYKWNNDQDLLDVAVLKAALHIYDMSERLAKLKPDPLPVHMEREALRSNTVEMNIEQLQNWTSGEGHKPMQVNWTEYFTLMFEDVENVTLDLEKDTIMVTNPQYLRNLFILLSVTPNKVLELTLWWQVVNMLAPLTNSDLRSLEQRYMEKATGSPNTESRSMFCTNTVTKLLGMAASYFIADPLSMKDVISKVTDMMAKIRWAFASLVRSAEWMDKDTQQMTIEKADALKLFVGYPDWLLNAEMLEEYYGDIDMNETSYLFNIIEVKQLIATYMLSMLKTLNTEDDWNIDPVEVNAVNSIEVNSIYVPSAILQFPFYGLGLQSLEYGAVGSLLGHELSHGFDSSGIHYDKHGNVRRWWSNSTMEKYVNRTACFIEQYDGYQLEKTESRVDGNMTVTENVADNVGLRGALKAYERFQAQNEPEPKLPGFEEFSDEQLFFLSFAFGNCENWGADSYSFYESDEHAPTYVRVLGTLSNFPEFAEAWKCRTGSAMNMQRQKCVLW